MMRTLSWSRPHRPAFLLGTILMTLIFLSANSSHAAESDLKYEREVAKGINEFAVDLYLELAKESDKKPVIENNGNIFFSPMAIYTTMAMAYAGASGETAKEMAKVMHFGSNVHKGIGLLERRIESNSARQFGSRIWVANSVWPYRLDDSKLYDRFSETMKQDYRTQISMLAYTSDSERARETINDWVQEETNYRIHDIVPTHSIDHNTSMVLTSGACLLGEWGYLFIPVYTKDGWFFSGKDANSRGKTRLPFSLLIKMSCRYEETNREQMLFLNDSSGEYYMLLILPQEGISLSDYEKDLHGKQL